MIDWCYKGFPGEAAAAIGRNVLSDGFPMPVAILRRDALDHNIAMMQDFADAVGARLCPHGKTTMSPEIFARQLAAGAWGMTAATAHHVRIYRQWGVPRILLANQLIGAGDLALVIDLLKAAPFDFLCLVDSPEGIGLLAEAARRAGLDRPIGVLVEIGAAQGRTGVRSPDAGFDLGMRIAAQGDVLALRGIELFEGIYPISGTGPGAVAGMLDDVAALAGRLYHAGHFAPGEIILTGGGSALFDLCAARLGDLDLGGRQQVVLRSGCYVVHDHGTYAQAVTQIHARAALPEVAGFTPRAALEVWGVVQSMPEPGAAIVSIGKRDVGCDADLPAVILHRRRGEGTPYPAPAGLRVDRLYDQHACLSGAEGLSIGDLVGFGISHPCTTFDKWRAMPVIDADDRVVDLITTAF